MAVCWAQDLLAGAQRLCLEGLLAPTWPQRSRYALRHIPGRLVRTARQPTRAWMPARLGRAC